MSNFDIGPSIDASYQIADQLALQFQKGILKCEKLMDDRRRTPSDGKSSHCLWQGELKSLLPPQHMITTAHAIVKHGSFFSKKAWPTNVPPLYFSRMLEETKVFLYISKLGTNNLIQINRQKKFFC